MEVKNLSCQACGTTFEFSAEEQEFYAEKGFQEPKKCKPCRQAAKQSRMGGRGPRPAREMYDVTCSACGTQTQVPFAPSENKPVYCKPCYQSASSFSGDRY